MYAATKGPGTAQAAGWTSYSAARRDFLLHLEAKHGLRGGGTGAEGAGG